MLIPNKPMMIKEIIEAEGTEYFSEDKMIKAVADVDQEILAINAGLHSDLEEILLEHGSRQESLYGFNIYYDDMEIEYYSLINPPRNRDDGYPRGGRDVCSPEKGEKIKEIVDTWILG